jgi:hypothetical protein
LANILHASQNTPDGWLIIDGGGNRPAFDSAIAEEADLCIFPFRPSHEDLDTVSRDMDRIANALAWPTAWPTISLLSLLRNLSLTAYPRNILHE